MINYHVIIAQEKRVSTALNPRALSTSVNNTSLHSMGGKIADLANPNILYCASWDGISDHVTVLKGSMGGLDMAYAGWPMTDKPQPVGRPI